MELVKVRLKEVTKDGRVIMRELNPHGKRPFLVNHMSPTGITNNMFQIQDWEEAELKCRDFEVDANQYFSVSHDKNEFHVLFDGHLKTRINSETLCTAELNEDNKLVNIKLIENVNKKLTAVELLWTKASNGEHLTPEDFQQAIELEKDNIENAYIQGFAECDATGMMDVDKYLKLVYGK